MKGNVAAAILLLILFQHSFSSASAIPIRAQGSAPVLDTTVCDLTAHPDQFDGKMVRVKVQFVSAPRGHAIKDADKRCSDALRLFYFHKRAVPTSSSPPSPSTSPKDISPPTLIDDDQVELLNKYLAGTMYPTMGGLSCRPCDRYEITATITGMVTFYFRTKIHGSDGPAPSDRFFFVQSVTDVKGRDIAATYDPKEYATDPVTYPRAYITGRLLAPDGNPLPITNVQISSAEKLSASKFNAQHETDSYGEFVFEVPPGSYILAINLDTGSSADLPYDTTYFPGTTDKAAATVFELKAGQRVDNVMFSLASAKRLPERKFSGTVEWPDGRPAADAFVQLTEVEIHKNLIFRNASARSDANGHFTLIGFEGKDYFVHAGAVVDDKAVCAEEVRVNSTASSAAVDLKLTVPSQVSCPAIISALTHRQPAN